jgi:molybdate/tungstate transport system ATP-binding protein
MESLRLSGLSVIRGSFRLHSITLDVSQQEYLVVIGPTGSGKTTLLKAIAGAFNRVSGRVQIEGNDVTDFPPEKRSVVYVPQNYSLFNHMSAYRNIEFGLRARGFPREEAEKSIRDISEELGITNLLDRNPLTLSGGEQQKVSLARALVTKPKVLLLDEPLSMVDPETQTRLLLVLKRIPQRHNCSVMHVTHNWDEAYALANKVAVINMGKLVEVGTTKSVFEKPRTQFSARLTGFQNILSGVATATSSGSIIDLGHGIKVTTNAKAEGLVAVCVRPEWIVVDATEGDNVLTGNVIDTLRERHGIRIIAWVNGIEFTLLSRKEFSVGEKVTFQIPPEVVHIVDSEQDS